MASWNTFRLLVLIREMDACENERRALYNVSAETSPVVFQRKHRPTMFPRKHPPA